MLMQYGMDRRVHGPARLQAPHVAAYAALAYMARHTAGLYSDRRGVRSRGVCMRAAPPPLNARCARFSPTAPYAFPACPSPHAPTTHTHALNPLTLVSPPATQIGAGPGPAEELLPLELRLGHAVTRSRKAAAAFLGACAAGSAACEALEAGAAGFKRSYYALQASIRQHEAAKVGAPGAGACGAVGQL